MLKEYFQKILSEYESVKENKIWDCSVVNLLKTDLPREIKKLTNLDLRYLFEGSVGHGNFSEVPWFRIYEEEISPSAQEEYYIVYLFDAKMQGVYISLNQGVTQYNELYGPSATQMMRKNTRKLRSKIKTLPEGLSFEEINLNAKQKLGNDYELCHICGKYYPAGKIPEDSILLEDLKKLIKVYEEFKEIIGNSVLNVDENYTPEEIEEIRIKNKKSKGKDFTEKENLETLIRLRNWIKSYENNLDNESSDEDYRKWKEKVEEIEERKD